MISDFIIINKKANTPLYLQIFNELRNAIENGNLKENERIPSVRKLCADLEVSKTTVENAYNLLCVQGYIVNMPQKGYFVEKGLKLEKSDRKKTTQSDKKKVYKYDFSGKGIDINCSNIKEWSKYVKDILNKDYLLNTYSENQGEEELRDAITKYAFTTRGVHTESKNIIVGSGSQTLIYILCGILGLYKTVAIEQNTFPQAEQVFRDFKYKIKYTKSDKKGISIESLNKIKPDILLLNPNYNSSNGSVMPIKRKMEIINWARANNCIIIEDDYNGELRYKTHPTACIQSYGVEQTVYIGSFSKILLPSVRISYMVMPNVLLEKYEKIKENYNQTTSKIEQLALAAYIRDGRLEKHLRKSRRYYSAKSEFMQKCVKKHFNSFVFNETGMYFELNINCTDTIRKCRENDINVMNTSTDDMLKLNISQISSELIESGIEQIANTIKESVC